MGVIKDLKAITGDTAGRTLRGPNQGSEEGAEYMLMHRLYKRSHDHSVIAKPRWTRLGFPLFWDTDALEMLEVLADLGCEDERMEDAIELVLSKRIPEGVWRNERSYAGRMLTNIEKQGAPSRWVTLRSLAVLEEAGQARLTGASRKQLYPRLIWQAKGIK